MKNVNLSAGIVAIMLGLSSAAHAGDCWTMLQKHFTWAQTDEWGQNHNLTFQLVTNSSDSHYASYAIGVMDVSSDDPWLFRTDAGQSGNRDGTQYFSDRQYQSCGSFGCFPVGPFDRVATDVLGVQLTWYGQVTFTLKSWGGGQMTGTGDCTNEMLIAHIGTTAFLLSFQQTTSPIVY